MRSVPLSRDFFAQDTLVVAQRLIGMRLLREMKGAQLAGIIVETEAYIGEEDPACHAAGGKTPRNAIMYGPPGFAYIYFIYGMYFCLNVVTAAEGFPAAVLIRAVAPISGIAQMQQLRHTSKLDQLASGPGKLCQAFGIGRELNGADLTRPPLWIASATDPAAADIRITTRIGIRKGTDKYWRFCQAQSPHVSHPKHR